MKTRLLVSLTAVIIALDSSKIPFYVFNVIFTGKKSMTSSILGGNCKLEKIP